jgi:drug/metabolite transporter (DMT)-like permease
MRWRRERAAGTIVGARNACAGIPVAASSGFGMSYGGITTAAFVNVAGIGWAWDGSWAYGLSLSYLVLFGSIAGFWCYLSVVATLGAERAAFIPVFFPLVALALSWAVEGYVWSTEALIGATLVVVGNGLALRKGRPTADPAFPTGRAAPSRP